MASVFKRKGRDGRLRNVWEFRFRNYLGERQQGVGWPDKRKTVEHALALEAEHRAIRNGEKEIPPAWLKLRNTPIRQVVDEYLASGMANGGRRGYGWSERHVTDRRLKLAFWIRELKLRTIGDITLSSVQGKAQEMLGRGRHGKTVSNCVEVVRALCLWAVRHGYLKENPLSEMPRFNTTPARPHRALSDDELRRLTGGAPPGRRLIYRTALATGYRAGELRALRVKDLDLFGPSLRLSGKFTKNRQDAQQPIARELAKDLQEAREGFDGDAPLLDMAKAHTVSGNFNRDRSKAGIRHVTDAGKATFHSLRVNFINAVVESGSDLKTIMTLARHGSAQMSMEVYAKPKATLIRKAAEAVAERMEEALAVETCCTGVAQAVGAGGQDLKRPRFSAVSRGERLVAPTGFEPVLRG